MIEILQSEPTVAVRDESALDIFRHQWELYRKFLAHDYLSNAGAYAELRRFLENGIGRPFRFLDLACGDASGIVGALKGAPIAHYHGVDLSPPALELAKGNLGALPCVVELEQADFVEAMRNSTLRPDIVWISLSLHHLPTPDKRTLLREVRDRLDAGGAFLIYEPTCREGEDRVGWVDRFEETGRREWTALSAEEFKEAMGHVRSCDLPETASGWVELGHQAGFSEVAELYRAPSDLFRMFSFWA
jgi:SAM-dependent methyltransferase